MVATRFLNKLKNIKTQKKNLGCQYTYTDPTDTNTDTGYRYNQIQQKERSKTKTHTSLKDIQLLYEKSKNLRRKKKSDVIIVLYGT